MPIPPMPELCIMGRPTEKDFEQIDAVVAWGEQGWARVKELEAPTSIAPSVTIHGMHHDPSNLYGISPDDWTKCSVYVRALLDRVKELEGVLKTTAEPMREALARIEELEASSLALIDQRDSYHDWADKLADAIAAHTGDEIGEHSSANNPWANALELIDGQRCR